MSGLFFEYAAAQVQAHPNRNDVACFIGYVARRKTVPLPVNGMAELQAGGWVDGPWRKMPEAVQSLEQLPVTVDNWAAFDSLFAWEQRQVSEGQEARCACYLGSAVRSFFATGGKRAVIIRVGDPWACVEPNHQRTRRRLTRLLNLLPGFIAPAKLSDPITPLPLDRYEPGTWKGLQHVYGLPQVSMVCMPDLPDLLSVDVAFTPALRDPPLSPEVFVECSEDEPALASDSALKMVAAPRCDYEGYRLWSVAIIMLRQFLQQHRPDVILLGAVPLPQPDTALKEALPAIYAEADLLAFLRGMGVLGESTVIDENKPPPSTFSQLTYPWLRTRRSGDLPEGIEPPDGLFAGLLAANALRKGTFRSVAGVMLPDVVETKPVPACGDSPNSPARQLAGRICLFAPEPGGIALQSDVTTSSDAAWQSGGVRRLVASVLRAAREAGDNYVFEANGPRLWARVRRGMEDLLAGFWQQGGLGGATLNEAFKVRCDRTTMSQNDMDNGRIVVEVALLPVAAIERITVVLRLEGSSGIQTNIREVA